MAVHELSKMQVTGMETGNVAAVNEVHHEMGRETLPRYK